MHKVFTNQKGCSASVGPVVSTIVLQHPQDRYHLITIHWSDIEPSPGNFDFTSLQNQINTIKSTNYEQARIDISHLPIGLYFIHIGNYSEKFMVVR